MSGSAKPIVDGALRLLLVGIVAVGTVSGVHHLTKDRIAAQHRLLQLRAVNTVLPTNLYDNDPLSDTLAITAPSPLSQTKDLIVYRARLAGVPSAVAMQMIASDGYNGDIDLLIGIELASGTSAKLLGVRVTNHRETPGLGDKIDRRVSNWVDDFVGRDQETRWDVRKFGGDFDQFTGATITPRAVIKAVERAIQFAADQREMLFQEASTNADGPGLTENEQSRH